MRKNTFRAGKRPFKVFLWIALAAVVSTVCAPAFARPSGNARAAGNYDYMTLLDCDSNFGLYSLDRADKMEGLGSVSNAALSGRQSIFNSIEAGSQALSQKPLNIDASAMDISVGGSALALWVKADRPLAGATEFSVSSESKRPLSTSADSIVWKLDSSGAQIQTGVWSWVVLDMTAADNAWMLTDAGVRALFSNLRYFGAHFAADSDAPVSLTAKIDDVRLINNGPADRIAPAYDGGDARTGAPKGVYSVYGGGATAPDAPDYYDFWNCDDSVSSEKYPMVSNNYNYKQGVASVGFQGPATGDTTVQLYAGYSVPPFRQTEDASKLLQDPMPGRDIGYSVNDAVLGFWLYFDSFSISLSAAPGYVMLGSGHGPNKDLFRWDAGLFNQNAAGADGWLWVTLPFENAQTLGSPDMANLNFFYISFTVGGVITEIDLDGVRVFRDKGADSFLPPDYPAGQASTGGAYISARASGYDQLSPKMINSAVRSTKTYWTAGVIVVSVLALLAAAGLAVLLSFILKGKIPALTGKAAVAGSGADGGKPDADGVGGSEAGVSAGPAGKEEGK